MRKTLRTPLRLLFGTAVLLAISILSTGNFSNPPNGHTGAPGDGLCTDCHTGGGSQDGSVMVTGFPATIIANQTYTLQVTVSNPNGMATFGGFQMVILNAQNQNAGTMSNPSQFSTIQTSAGRTYHEHNPAQSFPGNNMVTYSVDWTAPTGSGVLTYYAAGNVANGNGATNGDLIVTTSGSGDLLTQLVVAITNINHVTCFGAMNGSLTAAASFGTPPYTYNWSNGGSGTTISNLSPGTYTVTVTDNAATTATASATVNEPPLFQIVSADITHVTCNGGNNGQVIVTLAGGTPPYSGASGNIATFSNLSAGILNVAITDANGCQVTAQYQINQPLPVTIDLQVFIEPLCFGAATGFLSVDGAGGTGSLDFQWSNGGSGSVLQNIPAGTYGVTATDINGCTATESFILGQPPAVVIDLLVLEHVSCNGGDDGQIIVLASGGTGTLQYLWSNGAVTPAIVDLGPGSYTVTVTDDNGCTVSATYIVNQASPMSVGISGTTSLQCFGDANGMLTASVTGGVPEYAYAWSNGATTATISNLSAGVYIVTVTDAEGCAVTASTEITQPGQIQPNATSTNETAPGEMDGTATSAPTGGTGAYAFLWNTGDTTATITGLAIGSYTVTVTDGSGCTGSQTVVVSGVNCNLAVNVSTADALCFGEASGAAMAEITGANGNVTILWSTGDTTAVIFGLEAGIYNVTVTDEDGCVVITSGGVGQPDALTAQFEVEGVSDEGAEDGSILCMPFGGTAPYTFLWSTGDTTALITGLAPGVYHVTISDANGCEISGTAIISPFTCALELLFTVEDVLCAGDATGSASVAVSGGIEPYTITWYDGTGDAEIGMLASGTYGITVTDASLCVITGEAIISAPDPITATVDSIIHVLTGGTGAIFVTISGGTPPYTTTWTQDGETVSTEEDPSGLEAGDYSLMVVDANGCMLEAGQITITVSSGSADPGAEIAVTLWPNPAGRFLHLTYEHGVQLSNIAILTADGRHVQSWTASQIVAQGSDVMLPLDGLHAGLYYVVIENRQGRKVIPLVKL